MTFPSKEYLHRAFHSPHLWECHPIDGPANHPNQSCELVHYGQPWPEDDPDVWDGWEDAVGQWFIPGDVIAVATISGRSPKLVIAEVIRINRKNSSGELLLLGASATPTGKYDPGAKWVRIPACTVTAKPIYSRFSPLEKQDPNQRNSTYQFTSNIIKLAPEMAKSLLEKAELNTPTVE